MGCTQRVGLFLTLLLSAASSWASRIVPVTTSVTFTAQQAQQPWSAPVYSKRRTGRLRSRTGTGPRCWWSRCHSQSSNAKSGGQRRCARPDGGKCERAAASPLYGERSRTACTEVSIRRAGDDGSHEAGAAVAGYGDRCGGKSESDDWRLPNKHT